MNSVSWALPSGAPKKDSKIGDDILDHDLDEGEVHNPMNRARILTGLHNRRELVNAQIEGGFAFHGFESSQNPSSSSKQVRIALEPVNCAPPQEIKLARFPKTVREPDFVKKQTIDVKADKHRGDEKLNHIPNLREDWGNDEKWTAYRRADHVFVAPSDISAVELHGWYVVFSTFGPGYSTSKHILAEGKGKHVHDDFFIAKVSSRPDGQGWTAYVDMPKEFWTVEEKGEKVYECKLAQTGTSMTASLFVW